MITDAELAAHIEKQKWTEQVVQETFEKQPPSTIKSLAQDAISLSRKYLEQVVDRHLQINQD